MILILPRFVDVSFNVPPERWVAKGANDEHLGVFNTDEEAVKKVCNVTGFTVDYLLRFKHNNLSKTNKNTYEKSKKYQDPNP